MVEINKTIKTKLRKKLRSIASFTMAVMLVFSSGTIAKAETTDATVEKVVSVKEVLSTKVTEAKAVVLDDKTEKTSTAFKDALAKAEEVLLNTEATEEDLNKALATLVSTQDALKVKTKGFSVKPSTPEEVANTAKAAKPQDGQKLTSGTNFLNGGGTTVTEPLNIEFFNNDDQPIDLSQALAGGDGQNISLKVRVKLQENATSQKVEIILGNFVKFVSRGETNEVLKGFATISNVVNSGLITALDGTKYVDSTGAEVNNLSSTQTVTYTANADSTGFTIPFTIKIDEQIGSLKGLSTTGMINGSREGIEKTTPITVKITSTKDGQVSEKTLTLDQIATPDFVTGDPSHNYHYGVIPRTESAVATTANNYTVTIPYSYGYTIGSKGFYLNTFIESSEFELILPKGISFVGFAAQDGQAKTREQMFEKVSETDNGQNETVVKFKTKLHFVSSIAPLFKVRVDRNVYTQDKFVVKIGNHKIVRRHRPDSATSATYGTANYISQTFNILENTDQDDIAWFQTKIGTGNGTVYNVTREQGDQGHYTTLAAFPINNKVTNLDNTDSRNKELHYVFPENPNFQVKGFRVLDFQNGFKATSVKVRTKNVPDWTTVAITEDKFSPSGATDVVKLGFSADDVLTEVLYPVGNFKANTAYNPSNISIYGQSQVFGTISLTDNAVTNQKVADVTARDEGYNPASTDKNYSSGTGELFVRFAKDNNTGATAVRTDNIKTIDFGKTQAIKYIVDANSQYSWEWAATEKVNKIYLVLPTELNVKGVRFVKDKKEFTAAVVKKETTSGDKTIRTFDLSNVGDEKFIGLINKPGKGEFRNEIFEVYVDIENDVKETKDFPYNQTLFVEIENSRARVIAKSIRNIDPYDLAADDSKLYTNAQTDAYVRLTKADVLDLNSEAKLNTDNDFSSANTEFKINNTSQDLQVKLNINNPTKNEVGEIDLFIPIPKEGKSFGTNFQAEPFAFGFTLKDVDKNSTFDEIFDVTYATVDASKLNGQTTLNTASLSQEVFETNRRSESNLIRIKTKEGKKVPAESNYPITFGLGLDNPSTTQDGKTVVWNPYYKAVFADGSKVLKARDINISITLGKAAVRFFNDTNANGQLDSNETKFTSDVVFTLGNDRGQNVDLTNSKQTVGDNIVLNGLTSGNTYSLTATNENNATYRFTTGNKGVGAANTVHRISASLTDAGSAAVTLIGLTPKITLNNPAITLVEELNNLSPTEIASVDAKVQAANNNNLPENTRIKTNALGVVTITYPDGFTDTIPSSKTVQLRPTTEQPVVNPIDSDDTTLTGTGVPGAKITVRLANGTTLPEVTVGPGNNQWSVPLNGTQAKDSQITVTQKETEKKVSLPKTVTVQGTQAQQIEGTIQNPQKVQVANLSQLEQTEKDAVAQAIRTANPTIVGIINKIEVSNNGTAVVTFNDGSQYRFEPSQTVANQDKSSQPEINKITSDSTTVTGRGEPNSEITVTLPTGDAPLTTTVQTNGTWEVTLPKKLPADTRVSVTQKENNKTISDPATKLIEKTDAQKATVNLPTNKVKVNNLTALTTEEQNLVKAAVKAANVGLNETQIEVDANGKVTITYADNSKAYIEARDAVVLRETSDKPVVNPIDSNDTKISGHGIDDATIEITLPTTNEKKTTVVKNGKWSISLDYTIAAGKTIVVKQTEVDKKESAPVNAVVAKTNAETITPSNPTTPTKVNNLTALTTEEKAAVANSVKAANTTKFPPNTLVDVADNGDVTITYPDGTQDTIAANEVVVLRATSAPPTINKIDSDDKVITGTGVAGSKVVVTLQDGTTLAAATVEAGSNRWTVTLPTALATGTNVTAVQTETDKQPSTEISKAVEATQAEAANLTAPTPTPVANLLQLEQTEKDAVAQAIRDANTGKTSNIKTIVVDERGNATVTFNDLSTKVFTPNQTVTNQAKSVLPVVNKVDTDDQNLTGTGVAGSQITVYLPTGGNPLTTTVQADNSWTVSLAGKQLPAGTEVRVTQKETNKAVSDEARILVSKTTADLTNVNNPTITKVDDLQNVSTTEQDAIKAAVTAANASLNAQITVDNKGRVTITYQDGSKDYIEPVFTVALKEQTSKPFVNKVDSDDLTITGTGVEGAIIEVSLPNGVKKTATVTNGVWSVTLDAAVAKDTPVSVTQTETGKRPSVAFDLTVAPTLAESTTVNNPATLIKVDDVNALTTEEIAKVKKAVEDANTNLPAGTVVTVSNNGTVTFTYTDGSQNTIPAADIVVLRETTANPTVNKIDSDDMTISGTGVDGATIEVTLPDGTIKTATVVGGNWSIDLTAPLTTNQEVSIVQKEDDKKPSPTLTETVIATIAELTDVAKPTTITKVDDPMLLTQTEKDEVKKAVEDANKFAPIANIVVADNGDVTITYIDDSVDTLAAVDVIVLRETSAAPTVDFLDNDDMKVTGTGVDGSIIEVTLPGNVKKTAVVAGGKWSIDLDKSLQIGQIVAVVQKEADKKPSAVVDKVVVSIPVFVPTSSTRKQLPNSGVAAANTTFFGVTLLGLATAMLGLGKRRKEEE